MESADSGAVKTVRYKKVRPNGDTYVYEKQTRYDPQKKWNVALKTTLLGKIPKGCTEMVKTRPRRSKKADAQLAKPAIAACRRVGMVDLIEYIGSEFNIADDVLTAFGDSDGRKLLSIAWFLLATDGSPLPCIETWCTRHPTPYEYGITENIYHCLFDELGVNEDSLQRFFTCRAALIDPGGTIAFDSSTCSSYGTGIIDARYGYNKRNDGLPTVKVLVLYSVNGRQPIAFAKQPGNIPDVSSLSNALNCFKFLNLSKCTLCMDEGFSSRDNINELYAKGVRFLVRCSINSSIVKEEINAHREELHAPANICRMDHDVTCVKVKTIFEQKTVMKRSDKRTAVKKGDVKVNEHTLWVGVYHSISRSNLRASILHAELEELREQTENKVELSEAGKKMRDRFLKVTKGHGSVKTQIINEAFNDEVKRAGTFAIISNRDGKLEDWLFSYRLRENIEDVFSDLRNHGGTTTPRQWTTDGFKARLTVSFITLCYRFGFLSKINDAKVKLKDVITEKESRTKKKAKVERSLLSWIENKSLREILEWFDCIEETVVKTPAGTRRWSTEKTSRDQMFLDYLGYTQWAQSKKAKRLTAPLTLNQAADNF